MNALPVIAWCALMCGLTAGITGLFWHAAFTRLEADTETLTDALLTERAAHDATHRAHVECLNDCRKAGLNGARRHLGVVR